MSEMSKHVFKNAADGFPVLYGIMPVDYRERTELTPYIDNAGVRKFRIKGEVASPSGDVRILFETGKTYKDANMAAQAPTGGMEVRPFCDLKTQMDEHAAMVTGGNPAFVQFHEFSPEMQQKLSAEFNKNYNDTYTMLTTLIQNQGNNLNLQMGDPFLDGGIGEYTFGNKALFIAMSRNGFRTVVIERYMGRQLDNSLSWSIPVIGCLACDAEKKAEAFTVFKTLYESLEATAELKDYDRQLMQGTIQQSNMMYQQNQQMINNMWQQHNARWDAVKRQSDALSRNLDDFRAGLNQSMQQNDAWRASMFDNSSSGSYGMSGESIDDHVQRMRHESMMGVNTYVNEEGHETEFTTQADRVFESNLDNLDHFGTENYFGDFVPDGFKEIFKK